MDKVLNIGVVGCGYWGPNLVRNFQASDQAKVVVACDLNEQRLAHMQKLYPDLRVETDVNRLVEDPELDAVAVCTPVHQHFAVGHAMLEAGKHVFLEKPMASSTEECRKLVKLADEKQRILMVGHTFLYSSPVRKIKEIVDHGDIGDIRYISARRLNLGLYQKDINVVWDLAPHDLSIILSLMGKSPSAVNCQGSANVTPDIEDVANLCLTFPNTGFAVVQSSWLDPRKIRDMTIVGSKRMIVYDDLEPLLKIKVYDQRVEHPPYYDTFADFQYSYHYGDMYAPHIKQEEPLRVETQHFIDCIHSGAAPLTDGRAGMELVRILEASSQSLKQDGARIELTRDRRLSDQQTVTD